jgi:predicted nucleotidyltransferase
MRFGLSDEHWKLVEKLALAPLRNAGAKTWVFGSRARGDSQKFSDLDLLVSGAIPDTLLSQIREALEESPLPVRVDLVVEHELAESYRSSVEKDKISTA